MTKHSFADQGKMISRLINENDQDLGEFAVFLTKGPSAGGHATVRLLSAILVELQDLPKSLAKQLRRENQAQHNRDMALEREKQKTAAAVLKLKG